MSAVNDCIVGIDLGTTNSEIAAYVDDRVRVIGRRGNNLLPSVVGLSPEGKVLVGDEALNQALLYPERTVRSIKRKMGKDEIVVLGEEQFRPEEVSALILKSLVDSAASVLGYSPTRAVITVPAYFSDAQRTATREAGSLAGLEVLRIINEPTAASLAYSEGEEEASVTMVYDLGGGTFDVSVVRNEAGVTEVLASHGNNHLGGDDFTQKLYDWLVASFQEQHGVSLEGEPVAQSRLWWAAEEAKKALSAAPYAVVREENLVSGAAGALHLEQEISREMYDDLIRPLIETTLESVTITLEDAGLAAADLDDIILVGGATRTPLVVETLRQRSGKEPSASVHPDLCVALGAGVMASRLAGHDVDRVLVDVSPYSFGISHLGERGGFPYPHCYNPLIRRNTPLPVSRIERYFTSSPDQDRALVEVFQGEDEDALRNTPIGDFFIEGLASDGEADWENGNEMLVRMALNLNGILQVSVTEKRTGLAKHVTIENAFSERTDTEIQEARARLNSLYSSGPIDLGEMSLGDGEDDSLDLSDSDQEGGKSAVPSAEAEPLPAGLAPEAVKLLQRSKAMLDKMHEEDREEALDLHESIIDAAAKGDREALEDSQAELQDLLFYVGGN